MKTFYNGLKARAPRIKREAYLKELEFSPLTQDQFSITARWGSSRDIVDKKSGEYTKTYNRDTVFVGGRLNVRYKKTLCLFADDLIREILRKRGVVR